MPSFIDRVERNGFLRGYYNQLQYETEMKDLPKKQIKTQTKTHTKTKDPIIDKDGWTLVVKKKR